jgi:hypothetical protein
MKNIVYVSNAVMLLDNAELLNILTTARKNNAKLGVTGVLLYSDRIFIQLLEGDDADVDHIFGEIEKDARHKNMITLIDEEIHTKDFPDWSMGFSTPGPGKVKDILGYLQSVDNLKANQSNSAAVMTLKSFIESNNLTVNY